MTRFALATLAGVVLLAAAILLGHEERPEAPLEPQALGPGAASGSDVGVGARRLVGSASEAAPDAEVIPADEPAPTADRPPVPSRQPLTGATGTNSSTPADAPAIGRTERGASGRPRPLQPKRVQKISALHGDFPGTLVAGGRFGFGLALIEGVPGLLAVSAPNDEPNQGAPGVLWLLFLGAEGIATRVERIEVDDGPFAVASFSRAGEATRELALGCARWSTHDPRVLLLRLDDDWQVREREVLQQGDGILPPSRSLGSGFGASLAAWWTDEAEPRAQLAVGVPREADDTPQRGGLVAFLERWRGPFRLMGWLGPGAPGMPEDDGDDDWFGERMGTCVVGDERVLVVGATSVGGESNTWLLSVDGIGQITRARVWPGTWWRWGGIAVRPVGSSRIQVAVGTDPWPLRSEEILLLTGFPDRPPQTVRRSAHPKGERTERWGDGFGLALAWLDDLDGSGLPELAVGAPFDDDGGEDTGAVWILFF